MKKTTLQEVIDSVPARWAAQYRGSSSPHQAAKTPLLKALVPPLKAEDVNTIIGNKSWTQLSCDECGKSVELVVQIGQEPDYEASTAYICLPCLQAAVKLAKTKKEST